jgi:hypothetical protein
MVIQNPASPERTDSSTIRAMLVADSPAHAAAADAVPVATASAFESARIRQLGAAFFADLNPTPLAAPHWIAHDHRTAQALQLPAEWHQNAAWAQALRALSAQVWVTEVDPICALQAAMEGYRVVTMEYAADKADIFVTATGNYHVITHDHMQAMKNQAIVCNIGHFDNEIDCASLKQYQWDNIKPQVDHIIFPDGKRITLLAEGRLVNLGCGTGHPSYVMSSSFANQTIAQIELWSNHNKYPVGVHVLPKHLDEKVARLQLQKLGARLTELSDQQANYIGVTKQGPYKPDAYRY